MISSPVQSKAVILLFLFHYVVVPIVCMGLPHIRMKVMMLPLMDESNTPNFEPKEKCKVLQEVFFDGKHIEKENFDDVFKEEIEQEYEGLKTKDNLADEEKDSFLNRPLGIRETEAAIQSI